MVSMRFFAAVAICMVSLVVTSEAAKVSTASRDTTKLSCEESITQLQASKDFSKEVKDAIAAFFDPEVIEHEKRENSLRRICQHVAVTQGDDLFTHTLARCKTRFNELTATRGSGYATCIKKVTTYASPDGLPTIRTRLERAQSNERYGSHKKYDDNIKCFNQLQFLVRKKPQTDASSGMSSPTSSFTQPGSPMKRKPAQRDLNSLLPPPPGGASPPPPPSSPSAAVNGPPIDMGVTDDETELLKLTYALLRSVSKSELVLNSFFTPAADKQHIIDQFLVKVVYNVVRTTAIYHREDSETFSAFAKLRSDKLFEGDRLKIGSKAFREILKEISTTKTRLFDRCDKVVYVLNSMDVALDMGRANYERRLAIFRMVTRIVTSAFRVASAPIPVAGDLAVAFASATGDLLETLVTAKTDVKMRKLHVSGVLLTFFRSFIPRSETPKTAAVAEKLGVTPVEYPRFDECDPLVKRMFHVMRLMLEDETDKTTTPVGEVMNLCMPKEKDLSDHLLRVKSLFKLLKTFVDLDFDISAMTSTNVATRVGQYLKDNTAGWNTMGSQIRTLSK